MTQRFEQIYADHREAVRAYVRRRAPDALVDDVVSETFVVCLRRLDRVPPQPLPWLYAVAWKTLANERRKQARTANSQVLPFASPGPVGDGVLATAFTPSTSVTAKSCVLPRRTKGADPRRCGSRRGALDTVRSTRRESFA